MFDKEKLIEEMIQSFFNTIDVLNDYPIPNCGDRITKKLKGSAEDAQKLIKHVYNEYHDKITMPEMRVLFFPNGLYSVQVFEKKQKEK